MDEILLFSQENGAFLTMVFSGVVAISTVVYALLTWSLVRETKAMRQIYSEPKVDFTARSQRPHRGIFEAWVRNIGNGPAYNIRFQVIPISQGSATEKVIKELTSNKFISKGINYLSPGQSMDSFLTNMYEESEDKFHVKFDVIVKYTGSSGTTYQDVYNAEFSEHEGGRYIINDYVYESSKHLNNLSDAVSKLTNGQATLSVALKQGKKEK